MQLQLASSGLSAHQRAMAGIAFMDQTAPGWRSKIDRKTLNIRFDCTCAIAQVHGSYNENVGAGKLLPSNDFAADRGFFAYSHGTAGAKAEYAALTKAWLDILAAEDATRTQVQSYVARKRISQRAVATA